MLEAKGSVVGFGAGEEFVGCSNVEIGNVEPKRNYRLSVELSNDSLTNISFDSVRTSCNCAEFSVTAGEIIAGEKFQLNLDFRVPENTESGKYVFSTALFDGQKQAVRLNFRCRLDGNLHVKKRHHFVVRDKPQEVLLPINCSDPIDPSQLVIRKEGDFSDGVQAEIVKGPENYFARLRGVCLSPQNDAFF